MWVPQKNGWLMEKGKSQSKLDDDWGNPQGHGTPHLSMRSSQKPFKIPDRFGICRGDTPSVSRNLHQFPQKNGYIYLCIYIYTYIYNASIVFPLRTMISPGFLLAFPPRLGSRQRCSSQRCVVGGFLLHLAEHLGEALLLLSSRRFEQISG